jgi:protein phosphatase
VDTGANVDNQLQIIDSNALVNSDRVIIVGDIHGDLNALNSAVEHWDSKRDILVLLGDYADRGKRSIEVIERTIQLLDEYPDRVIGLRGNHEDYSENGEPYFSPCDLVDQVVAIRGGWDDFWLNTYRPFIRGLKLAAIIPGETLFVHGGVSLKIRDRADLERPTDDIELDVLYSDPTSEFAGEEMNTLRRCGVLFGSDVTKTVCERLGVKRIVRGHSHAIARFKPHLAHSGRVTTVISSAVFSSNPYVLVAEVGKYDCMQRMRLSDGHLSDLEIEPTPPLADVSDVDGTDSIRPFHLEAEVGQAYKQLDRFCSAGVLSARYRLPFLAHLAAAEGCEFFRIPVSELAGIPERQSDQRCLIVEMHRLSRKIARVFYGTQLTASCIRRIER